jgi:hypothetical protein
LLPLGWNTVQIERQHLTGGKLQIQLKPLLVQCKQQANPLLLMHNYTPPVISRNDKNKQLTLLSQRKLALTALKVVGERGGVKKVANNRNWP